MNKSDAELLADVLGVRIDKAKKLLAEKGGLRGLMSPDTMLADTDLTAGQIARIDSLRELERRHLTEDLLGRSIVKDPASVIEYLTGSIRDRAVEVYKVLFLNKANAVIASEDLFVGTIDQTAVHPREILRRVLYHNSTAVIVAHNHPSGRVEPSIEDRTMTDRVKAALNVIGCVLLDHIIVGDNQHYSFKEHGLV